MLCFFSYKQSYILISAEQQSGFVIEFARFTPPCSGIEEGSVALRDCLRVERGCLQRQHFHNLPDAAECREELQLQERIKRRTFLASAN